MLRGYRFLWVKGRFGGGKTSLSLKLADMLISSRSARYVVCNFPLNVDVPCEITTDVGKAQKVENAVLLLDEAGQFLDVGAGPRQIKEWFSYLRKANQVVIMASVLPIAKFAAMFTVQRLFNGLGLGLPFWWYRWRLTNGDTKDMGSFAWFNPGEVWGLYDTDYRLDDRWFIYDWQNDSGDGDGAAAAVGVGIENELCAYDLHGCNAGGAGVGDHVLLDLPGIGSRTGVSEPASYGDGYVNGSGRSGRG